MSTVVIAEVGAMDVPVADRHSPLAGRTHELAVLADLLTTAQRTAFVVVIGEPGIGKSRLLQQAARDAPGLVLWGRMTGSPRGRPLALIRDVIEGLDRLVPAAEPGAALLQRLPARYAWRCPGRDASADLRAIYEHVRSALTVVARKRPTLLILDDLQWADAASVDLVDYLVRHPPQGGAVIVLSGRTGRLPAALVTSLAATAAAVVHLPLGPLSAAEAELLLTTHPAAHRRRLHALAGGNPAYLAILDELPARLVEEVGHNPLAGGDEAWPALDALVSRELAALVRPQRLVVQAAAVAGDDLDPALVARIAALAEDVAGEAIDALVERDVLRPIGGQLRFRHPLVRAAAYRMAGPAWRSAAHRRAAAHLSRQGAPAWRRAEQIQHSVRPGDLVAAELLATAAARPTTEPERAADMARAALRALPDHEALAGRRAEVQLTLGWALTWTGRVEEARRVLHPLPGSQGIDRGRAVMVLAVAERIQGRLPEAVALLAGALPGADAARVKSMLLVELATTQALLGDWGNALAAATAALRIAQEGAVPVIPVAALTLMGLCELHQGQFRRAYRVLDDARTGTDGLSDAELCDVMGTVAMLSWAEILVDQYDDARRHADRGVRVAREHGRWPDLPYLLAVRATLRARTGQPRAALADVEDGEYAARRVDSREPLALAAAARVLPALLCDGPAVMADLWPNTERPRSAWLAGIVAQHVAEALALAGDLRTCRAVLAGTGGRDRGPATVAEFGLRARSEAAGGDLVMARHWCEQAAALAAAGAPRAQFGWLAHTRAFLHLAEDRPGPARQHADEAVSHFAAVGLPLAEHQARALLGTALTAAGDTAGGRGQLERARSGLADLGASWLLDQPMASRPRRRAQPAAPTQPLSAREQEVAELVAHGLTNRQIADRLYLSPRTVDSHLNRAYHKLGVTNRAALVRVVTLGSGRPAEGRRGRPA